MLTFPFSWLAPIKFDEQLIYAHLRNSKIFLFKQVFFRHDFIGSFIGGKNVWNFRESFQESHISHFLCIFSISKIMEVR